MIIIDKEGVIRFKQTYTSAGDADPRVILAEVDPGLREAGSQWRPAFIRDHLDRVLGCQFQYLQEIPERSAGSAIAVRVIKEPAFFSLTSDLFDWFMTHEIVIDTTVLGALAPSPLALDLYLGLAEACFANRDPFVLSWREVYASFAFDTPLSPTPEQLGAFREEVRGALARIAAA